MARNLSFLARFRGGLLALLAGIGLIAPASAAPDYGWILDLMLTAVQDHPEVASARIDAAEQAVVVTLKDSRGFTMYPHSLAVKVAAEPDLPGKMAAVRAHVGSIFSQIPEKDPQIGIADLERVHPVIRTTEFGQAIGQEPDSLPMSDPLVPGLSIYYVLDAPQTATYLSPKMLAGAGLTRDDVTQAAARTLDRRRTELRHEGQEVLMFGLDGVYESSFLLDPVLMNDLTKRYGPVVVVAIPGRDVLMAADARNPESVRALRSWVGANFARISYPVTPDLLVWQDGNWRILAP